MKRRAGAAVALLGWAVGAALMIAVLARSPVRDDEPVSAAFEVLRHAALAGAWYVLGITVLGIAARAGRAVWLVRLVDAITVRPLRATLRAALGVGLSSVLTFSTVAVAATDTPSQPPIVTLERLPEASAPAPPPSAVTTAAPTTTTAVPTTTTRPAAPTRPSGPEVVLRPARPPAPPPSPSPAGTWPVRGGDCFWTIADRVLTTRLGRPVSDREIVPYWRRLIAENRSRLRDPANPDLLFPGQMLVVP